jgi:hypothetical protein
MPNLAMTTSLIKPVASNTLSCSRNVRYTHQIEIDGIWNSKAREGESEREWVVEAGYEVDGVWNSKASEGESEWEWERDYRKEEQRHPVQY